MNVIGFFFFLISVTLCVKIAAIRVVRSKVEFISQLTSNSCAFYKALHIVFIIHFLFQFAGLAFDLMLRAGSRTLRRGCASLFCVEQFVRHREKEKSGTWGCISSLPSVLWSAVSAFRGLPMPPIGLIAAVHNKSQSFPQETEGKEGQEGGREGGREERREGRRESGKTDKRQRKQGERKGEEWWWVTEQERMSEGGRERRRKEPEGGVEKKLSGRRWGDGGGERGGRRGREREKERGKEDLMNVDHCPST